MVSGRAEHGSGLPRLRPSVPAPRPAGLPRFRGHHRASGVTSRPTFAARVPQHRVRHDHDGSPQDVGQDEDVELLQALVHGVLGVVHTRRQSGRPVAGLLGKAAWRWSTSPPRLSPWTLDITATWGHLTPPAPSPTLGRGVSGGECDGRRPPRQGLPGGRGRLRGAGWGAVLGHE